MREDGTVRQIAGRAWLASELRQKSLEDLHKLWFVCLRERDMLATERLYFKQKRLAGPDMRRWQLVKRTMSRIKVVLGERQRAFAALQRVRQDASEYPTPLQPEAPAEAPSLLKPASEPHAWAAQGRTGVGSRLVGEMVTIKRFGRRMRVPADHPFAMRPTRSELNTAMRRGAYALSREKERRDAREQLKRGLAALPADVRELVDDEGRLVESRMRLEEEDAMEAATQAEDTRFAEEGRQ